MDLKKNVMLILVVVICVSFFLPWVTVSGGDSIGKLTKMISGEEKNIKQSISGFAVPVMANSEESRMMITIIKIFQPNITDADKKSYLIWLIPLLAVAIFFTTKAMPSNKWLRLTFGLIGILIFAGATFKILTTDLDKVVLKVSIGYGLWLILLGYLGIGIIQMGEFLKLKKS